MNNKLVIINQSGGHMDIDVANLAVERFDQVVMLGNFKAMERRPDGRIRFDKLVRLDKSSTLKRLWTWGAASVQVFCKLLVRYRGWEVLYYTNPPMACWSSLLLNNKFSIMEYDIYPDALKTIGLDENSLVSRFWGWANRKLFAKAERINTLSEGMKLCLAKYGSEQKMKVVPLWSASSEFKPIENRNNPFLQKLGLQDKFIVLYSGNIGYTHSVEVLVEVANRMKDDKNVHFLIIGQGKKKAKIVSEVKRLALDNVTLLDYQPVDVLPFSLASADLGVITLDENVAQVSVPSKTFNLLAVGAPILAIANNQTEMFRLIKRYECGRCIPKSEVDSIVSYINCLNSDEAHRSMLCDHSVDASRDFTLENAKLYFE